MNDLIIQRMEKTIRLLKVLKEEQFNFASYVSHYIETEDGAIVPTVCDIAGWYPKHFPDSGLSYIKIPHRSKKALKYEVTIGSNLLNLNEWHQGDIKKQLETYHGLPSSLISMLFYGTIEYVHLTEKGLDKVSSILRFNHRVKMNLSKYEKMDAHNLGHIQISSLRRSKSSLHQIKDLFQIIYFLLKHDFIREGF